MYRALGESFVAILSFFPKLKVFADQQPTKKKDWTGLLDYPSPKQRKQKKSTLCLAV